MSANPQALGAALYTLGQGISGASDAYFSGQIKAAQTAQETALKAMQIKAEEEQRTAAAQETAAYHADTLKQRGDEFNQSMAQKQKAEQDTSAYRTQDLVLKATQVRNEASHQKSTDVFNNARLGETMRHDRAMEGIDANKVPASHSQLPVLKTQIEESDKTISGLQKQMATAGSYSDSYKGLQAKLQAEQAKRDNLMKQLSSLSTSGVAPMANPQAPAPAAPKPEAPRASATSAANPAHVASQSDYDALPAGAFFINPSDGKVYQKKG